MSEGNEKSFLFTIGNTAQEKGSPCVPERYVVSPTNRSSSNPEKAQVPTIDMTRFRRNDSDERLVAIKELGDACSHGGFFQVVNHGISQSILDEALSVAFDFFDSPMEEKIKLKSNDVYKPVRYGTSLKDGVDRVQFWRVFLKHYAHPLDAWIDSWPENPPAYREKMGKYAVEVRKLAVELMKLIAEILNVVSNQLNQRMEDGMQVMTVNCYPPCPEPDIALGLPPHSDYSCLTVVLQSSTGLEILDIEDGKWKVVPDLHGTLQVHIGDHFEVMSNGMYKSVVHRATLNHEKTRISLVSLHSLRMDDKVGPAEELVDENEGPKRYKESSFRDFLDFITKNDIGDGKSFIEALKIKEEKNN